MGKRRRYPIVIDDQCVGWVTATQPPSEELMKAMEALAIAAQGQLKDDQK